ncbi:hypothetical protein ASF04_15940 [Duganella sp. Leaf61]|uniref:MAC/perforin domain-containing protein n=1 Tax=Duganella sp. Leaf61 TaxID=1736227 RepID=UPI00071257E0|nr:MAC/perforin domain-containing protein [Duganella sp. Leaf61]KQN69045.1 hypothetical protein ASF04_15940 [Duganella sp. Leaf61]
MSNQNASGQESIEVEDKPVTEALSGVEQAPRGPEDNSGSGEAKAESGTESKVEGNADAIAGVKTDVKADGNGDAKPDANANINVEAKPDTNVKPDIKSDATPATVVTVEDKAASTPVTKSLEEEELELSKQEKKERLAERKKELAQREKEANDRRSQLIKAVRFSAPAIDKALVDKFEALSIDSHAFAAKDVVKLMTNDAKLPEKVLDFFDLNLAQREDLLDRIGYYKGIVIDHSAANPVETGFREVLQRTRVASKLSKHGGNLVTGILYRKPNFSGYHENYYTSSESLHQVQKNGVTDIKSSLSVAGGKAASVGVGVSGSSHESNSSNSGTVKKKLYITANYFLPKIELSFDDSFPCASDEFEAACEEALATSTPESRFEGLVAVLGKFGQFVATQTLVGGRLFATSVKEFSGNESQEEMVQRYAARIKVAAESVTASFESDTSVEKSNQTNDRDKGRNEQQSATIHGVGGEGAVVEQAGRWAESLYDYRRWAAVQRENLIPSIDLLNKKLRARVWDALGTFAVKNTALHLVGEYKAYFLFYGRYDVEIGQLTRHDNVILKNKGSERCLAVLGETPLSGGVIGKPFEWSQQLLWRITPNGNIVSTIPVSSGFPGRKQAVDFALTVVGKVPEKDAARPPTLAVELRELGSGANQVWDFTGRGELRNAACGAGYALSMPLDHKPSLKLVGDGKDDTTIWSVREAAPEDIAKMEAHKAYGKLVHPSGLVLAIDGYEDSANTFALADRRRVLLQPDNGSKHQLWHVRSDGVIISALTIGSNNSSMTADVYLALADDKRVYAQGESIAAKVFKTDDKGRAHVLDAAQKALYAGAVVAKPASGQRVTVMEGHGDALTFTAMPADTRPITYSTGTAVKSDGCYRLKTVDKRELKIDGYLTGIEFVLEQRNPGRIFKIDEYFRMRMRLSVVRKAGATTMELKDEPDNDTDRDFVSDADGVSDIRVDERFLLLPEGPIYSLRLHTGGKKRLAFEYRLVENGPWIGLSDSDDPTQPLNVNLLNVGSALDAAASGTRVVGVALEYDASAQLLKPKLLRKLLS